MRVTEVLQRPRRLGDVNAQKLTSRGESGGDQGSFETNPRLLVAEAFMFAAVVIIGGLLTYELLRARNAPSQSNTMVVPGLLEADTLPVLGKAGDFTFAAQDTSTFPQGQWSGSKHLFAGARSVGDSLSLELPAVSSGSYELTAYLTKSFDYGIVQISVNEDNVGEPVDLWSYVVESTGPLRLGRVELSGIGDVIRTVVVGKNERSAAPFYQFGIDGFVLAPTP